MDAFGYFSRRRKRESALPPGALAELSAGDAAEPTASASDHSPASPEADDGDARVTEAPGSDAAELGELLRRAATTGLPQVTTETHAVDLRAGGFAAEIAEILGGQPHPDPDLDQRDTASP